MSRFRKILLALLILLSDQFLSPGFSTAKTFTIAQPTAPSFKAASHNHAGVAEVSATNTDRREALEIYGELMPRSAAALTARGNVSLSLRRFTVLTVFVESILTPKVPRYISNSVLNI